MPMNAAFLRREISIPDEEQGLTPRMRKSSSHTIEIEHDKGTGPEKRSYSSKEQAFWLLMWVINNIAVTLLNKSVFHHMNFNYPYALSAVHMAVNTLGAHIYAYNSTLNLKKLEWKHQKIIFAFSFLFAANIAVGNQSLRFVSVNFNQVMRSLVPMVVMGMSYFVLKVRYSPRRVFSVVPVVVGVAMACLGEMRYNSVGFLVTVLCVILAALKAVVSGLALSGEMKLHSIDLLIKMAPLAGVECLVMSYASGELTEIVQRWSELVESRAIHLVLLTGVLAFFLNVLSFQANKVTSPLTLTISANAKQALLIALSILVFNTAVSVLNVVGIVVVMVGSFIYSYISMLEKKG
mmetsp:Transcript_19254/g.27803  ORF Transcript_19254/g.27803 Transcript_19254/m.27803 type:complete len:350 (-) Transcript_19254:57-1106(-)